MALRYIFKSILTLLVCTTFVGCNSTDAGNKQSQVTNDEVVSISATELAQLKESAAQWQQAKPGVERLLVIEQDLKLLINQLNAVVAQESSKAEQAEVTSPEVKPAAPVTAVKPKVTTQPIYALQVASVTQKVRLAKSVADLQGKAPQLFEGKFVANVEPIDVNGVTYYRLKLGAYQYQQNAKDACTNFKLYNVSCLVTHYTDNPYQP
ncbi:MULTISPECIES: SPOR domain-containing protein [unclassified Pseudoalteromonas]|uniref:SPOR domain-containing protein n=1 Tax=unclassified Pseudoalteromonas TaxID=194690 RepID=UPI0025B5D96E|nr:MULTISPECIES: SPOR domain-containing protein [unclassified Pseudoalteromonas]MDN3379312.1 SPOR domain-containing protein [Pseudoalteromonas sp. APC 3893]MDN3386486.1 SPOR domain-containing protein [Pseudoalteromonas sp. APC 4017]